MIQSIRKAFDVLEHLAGVDPAAGGATLSEVAERLGDRPSTARNILKTMEGRGYVARADGRRYVLGPRCAGLTQSAGLARWRHAAPEALRTLAEATGEAALLAALVDADRRVVCRVAGGGVVSVDAGRAEEKPFWGLVTARAMAAQVPPEALDSIVGRHGLPGRWWGGIRSRRKLNEALSAIRKAGHAADVDGRDIGSLAVAIESTDGTVGAVGLYFPIYRYDRTKRKAWLSALKKAAKRIGDCHAR